MRTWPVGNPEGARPGRFRVTKVKRGGQAHRQCSFPYVFSSGEETDRFPLSTLPFFFFSMSGGFGGRRQGRPTRIDHFDLGQDMVF